MATTIDPRKLRDEAAKLIAQAEVLEKRSPEVFLADHLHSILCTHDLGGECGYLYELEKDFHTEGATRNMYYKRAVLLIRWLSMEHITMTKEQIVEFVHLATKG